MESTSTVPQINIISDEIVRPPAQVYLENGASRYVAPSWRDVGCRGESPKKKLCLPEGVGEDFLTTNPSKIDEEFYLGDAFFATDPSNGEVVPQTESQISAAASEELESVLQILEKANNQAPSTPSSDSLTINPSKNDEEFYLGDTFFTADPIAGSSKRKIQKCGKGSKKIRRRSGKDISFESELLETEENTVVQNFKKLVSAVIEKKKYYEGLRMQRESIVHRKVDAEAQQQVFDNNLQQALEQMIQLKKTVAELRAICRENNKLVESLKAEEKKAVVAGKYNEEQLNKHSRRLNKLQQITLDIL